MKIIKLITYLEGKKKVSVLINSKSKLKTTTVGGESTIVVEDVGTGTIYGFYSSRHLEEKVVEDYCQVLNNWIPKCDISELDLLGIFDWGVVLGR